MMPVPVYISFARQDAAMVRVLEQHLTPMVRRNMLSLWHRDQQHGGDNLEEAAIRLRQARIVLLLVSPDLESDRYDEIQQALALRQEGVVVVPVLIRPINLAHVDYAALAPLPQNGKPVSQWRSSDEALAAVASGIGAVAEQVAKTSSSAPWVAPPQSPVRIPETAEEILKAVRVRRYLRNLPVGLDQELAEIFLAIGNVQAIVRDARTLLARVCPGDMALPLSYISFDAGALVAWQTTITEAAKVGPRALVAVLLSARRLTGNDMPVLHQTLMHVLAEE